MELKARIKILTAHLGLSVREFERECGLKRGNISNMTGALGSDKLSKIVSRFPDVDLYWLLTGYGQMFREAAGQQAQAQVDNSDLLGLVDSMMLNLTDYAERQSRQIKLLQKLIERKKKEM